MNVLQVLVGFAVDVVVGSAFLWVAMKFTARVIAGMQAGASYCSWKEILVASAAASLARLVPPNFVGWVLSWAVLFVLLKRFSGASFGEIFLIVLINRIVVFYLSMFFLVSMLV